MKRKFNQNYQVRIIFIIALVILFIPYSFGQIGFDNTTMQLPNNDKSWLVAVEIGDVNNDGLNDIVVAARYNSQINEQNIYIYKQLPEGGLSEPVKLPYSEGRFSPIISDIEIADLNNDGLNDIAILYQTQKVDLNDDGSITIINKEMLSIFYQQADGSFGDIQDLPVNMQLNSGIKCGDLNNDGLIDIIGYSYANNSYQIFYQKPEGGFSLTEIPSTLTIYCDSSCPNLIEIGDLNGDGLNDIARIYTSEIEIFFQKEGVGIHADNSIILTDLQHREFSKLAIGDVNNDGKNDIVATSGGNRPNANIIIFYQTENGIFSPLNTKVIETYDIPVPIFIVDFNCDGNNELVVGHNAWGSITTYEKSVTGEYDSYVRYPSSSYYFNPFSMAIGDINNDNRPDIVSVEQNGLINILYNTSKPLTFDKIENKIRDLTVETNTTTETNIVYETLFDENTVCPLNTFYKLDITETFENTHYKGDTIRIREGFLCSAYIDSLKIPFHYIESKLIKSDTIKTLANNNWLQAFVFEPNLAANADTTVIYIGSNTCWDVSCDQDWLQFDIYSGEKSAYILITVVPNESETNRIANITITGDNVSPTTISITQSGAGTNNITDVTTNPDFYINPTTKKLIITKVDLSETVKAKIYDLSGKIVWIENLKSTPIEIDLNSLIQGVYVLTFEFSNRRIGHKIIIH